MEKEGRWSRKKGKWSKKEGRWIRRMELEGRKVEQPKYLKNPIYLQYMFILFFLNKILSEFCLEVGVF